MTDQIPKSGKFNNFIRSWTANINSMNAEIVSKVMAHQNILGDEDQIKKPFFQKHKFTLLFFVLLAALAALMYVVNWMVWYMVLSRILMILVVVWIIQVVAVAVKNIFVKKWKK